jgi:BirA family transcriptional regulator, biotin operon repressor / biotin---[acetyl-CoA-carboxylase] ligase
MIVRLRETTSTMKDAAALAAKGEPHGTAVIADLQTAGIGRHGHQWHSENQGGLYLSIILRREIAPSLTLALGLAVQRALHDVAEVSTDLRWPNDVLLNNRKLAGILAQSAEGAVIAGIGLNVNQTEFPPDLAEIATSLRIETGREFSKDVLAERIITESLRYTALSKQEILSRFEENSTWPKGKSVIVDDKIQGVTAGLDENGFLLVQTADKQETIMAGGVRCSVGLRPAHSEGAHT